MAHCHCCKKHQCTKHHGAHKCKRTGLASPPLKSNLVEVREDFNFEMRKDFFDEFKLKGSTFKLRNLVMKEDKIAVKWVRQAHGCGFKKHIKHLQNASETTASVITSFMKRIDTNGWDIKVIMPRKYCVTNYEIAVEPFIKDVKRFNSNSFWECSAGRTYEKVVLALSHFSFAASKGEYVLANFRGGVDEQRKIVTLLPPTVISTDPGKNGCMDVGKANAFFSKHTCNSFCHGIPMPE